LAGILGETEEQASSNIADTSSSSAGVTEQTVKLKSKLSMLKFVNKSMTRTKYSNKACIK